MDRQILFFDIDDTLLSGKTKEIPQSATDAINQARANGHVAVINTGRTQNAVPKRVRRIDFDAYLYGCGTHIEYQGQTLMRRSFPKDEADKIIDLLKPCGVEAFLEAAEDVYCSRNYRMPQMNMVKASFQKLGFSRNKFIEDKDFIFDKYCILTDADSDIDRYIRELDGIVDFMKRVRGIYECSPAGYSKATAMRYLADHLGISMANTWVFGDSSNDLPMFKAGAHAIAMAKHDDVLDPYAEFITDTVENDGIAKAMKKAGLIV